MGIADSNINTAVAPDPETKSHPRGSSLGTGVVKTPLYHGVITPIQFGPMSVHPAPDTMPDIDSSSFLPSSPASLKPADIMIKAFVFFSLINTSTTGRQYFACIAIIARSASGISLISR